MRSTDPPVAVSPLEPATRARWRREFRAALERLVDVWYPRVIDAEHGGYLCDFDWRWRPTGPHRKMLEFQARQARVTAVLAAALPERPELRAAADHGFAFLRDAMWDPEFGGFYRILERDGAPLEEGTKHGHGTSYAISACVAHHRLTGSRDSLDLAVRAFEWLERHGHDPRHGGYHGYYRRDGRLILEGSDSPAGYPHRDPIGTPLGLKDVNTTKDLMETMAVLAEVWADDPVLDRLREMLGIVRERVVAPPGSCHVYFQPDWTPVPDICHYGHNLHMASILLTSGAPLGPAEAERCEGVARALLDTALAHGWDRVTGGFAYAGSTYGPIELEGEVLYMDTKIWWPQAEGLVCLVHFAARDGDAYARRAERLWQYIQTRLVDARHGGWYRMGLDAGRHVRKLPKFDLWKDGCHEGMALAKCLRTLNAYGDGTAP